MNSKAGRNAENGEKITASELPGTPVGSQFAPLLQLLFSAPVQTFVAFADADKIRNIPVRIIEVESVHGLFL